MEINVLGPLQVCAGGVALPLGARKQQTVLGLLAVSANRVVGLEELIDELWPENPPASAVANIRSYAANLRRAFEAVEVRRDRLARHEAGYLLRLEPGESDLLAFSSTRAAARDQAITTAAARLTEALAYWRGPVLSGLRRGPLLASRCAVVEEERLSVTEELAELRIDLAEPDQAVALLSEHVRTHPLRERGHALLMRALYLTGDTAGALARYAEARAALVDQLGVEPGPELQDLHRAILNRTVEPRPAVAVTLTTRPRELPPEVGSFLGRTDESARIRSALAEPDRKRHRPTVVVLYGPGGVGKSALAVHVAHDLAGEYPDGQLYVDLFGSTPGLRPLSTADALARFLRSLGVRPDEVPSSEADAVARWRTATADRRLLIVLDNASDSAQVKALLPASPGCGVLVTSRSPLSTLDADHRIRLEGMSERESLALLRRLTGTIDIDEATAARIVELCGRLPLALRVAAGRLAGRPDLPPQEFAQRLADRRRRLDELELDGVGVRWCIRVGYQALATDGGKLSQLAARAFRVLGLLNVPDVQPGVVTAMLTESDVDVVRAALDHLVAAQLLEPVPGGRYRFHDLVRLVAAECAHDEDTESVRDDALYRGLAYYAGSLYRAEELVRTGNLLRYGDPALPANLTLQAFAEPTTVSAWIKTELRCSVAAAVQAASLAGRPRRLLLLIAEILWRHLWIRHEWHTAHQLGLLAIDTGHQDDDPQLAGWGHLAVGRGEADRGNYDISEHHFQQALALHREVGHVQGVALTLNALGIVAKFRGGPASSLAWYAEGLELTRKHGLAAFEALLLGNLGIIEASLGRSHEALVSFGRSLEVWRQQADPINVASLLANMAIVHCLRGDLVTARNHANEALATSRQAGDQFHEHEALLARSEAHLRAGNHAAAAHDIDAVLSLARMRGARYAEATALRQHAKLLVVLGRPEDAETVRAMVKTDLALLHTRREVLLEALFDEGE